MKHRRFDFTTSPDLANLIVFTADSYGISVRELLRLVVLKHFGDSRASRVLSVYSVLLSND